MRPNRSSDLKTRVLKNFTDILILKYLKQNPKSSGYQILHGLHDKHSVTYSPGTIYNVIYTLERNGLISSDGDTICRVYSLTAKARKPS